MTNKLQQAKEALLDRIIRGEDDIVNAKAYASLVSAEMQEMAIGFATKPCPECVNPFEDGEEEEIG